MKIFIKNLGPWLLLSIFLSLPVRAELQTTVNLTASKQFNGSEGTFSMTQVSGLPSVASGTLSRTYSGISKFYLSSASGRYSSNVGGNFYGLEIGPLYLIRNFVVNRFYTIVNSSTICPTTNTYSWVGVRFRTPTTNVNPQDASSTSFIAGGTYAFDRSGTHMVTGQTSFDLAGPTLNSSASYYADGYSGADCTSGYLKFQAGGTQDALGAFGWLYFGDRTFLGVASGGDPVVSYGVVQETLAAPTLANLSNSVFSGLYTSYDAPSSQTQSNIFMYPDAAGTTFTLYTSTNLNDPAQKTSLGTLACTTINSPTTGFCSGTLTLSGVSGSGKAVCAISTQTPETTIACAAQRPSATKVAISIIGTIPAKSLLALTGPSTVASTAPSTSTTFSVTLTNLSGRKISSLANPSSGGLQLSAPFSNTGAYAGTGGTCGSTLAGYSSCNVTITYAPSAVGTHTQIFRVAYNDGYFGTVNATVPVYGTSGLVSIAVTPSTATFAVGNTVQYTATATYSNSSTQDISSIVTWSSSNSAVALALSKGSTSFLTQGSATLTATLGAISGNRSVTISSGSSIQVVGQDSATSFAGAVTGLNGPRGMIYAGNRLFLADTYNHRVLIWDSLPSSNQVPPDRVIGQVSSNGTTANFEGVTNRTLNTPFAMASDGTKLFVSDSYNHRVLIWNTIPTSNGQAADVVLGQANFTSNSANAGGSTSASSFNYPLGIAVSNGKLLVADFNNNRVLIWNTIPTANNTAADVVLGQSTMTASGANAGGIGSSTVSTPYGCSTDGTRVFVADTGNNRVLIWNTIPTTNKAAANVVLGQANFTSSTANNGGISASRMSSPRQIHSTGSKLIISDRTNNRVLIYNSIPAANGAAADIVLGQPNFTASTANNGGLSSQSISEPYGVYMDSSRVMVADINNNRILFWTSAPSVNQQAANIVLGQPNFTVGGINGNGYTSSSRLNSPSNLTISGTKLVVADTVNNRVLIWNTLPTTNGQAADVVVGQANMTDNDPNGGGSGSASVLNQPRDALIVGTKLIVADTGNHRVLIWNTVPTTNGASANVVVGQTAMTGTSANKGGAISASSLSSPYALVSNGTYLFVADYGNNRILKYNAIPTANNTSADIRLGQANFTSGSTGTSTTTLNGPAGLAISGTNLVAADYNNNRVLIWTTIPTTNQPAANLQLGQPNFTSSTANNGGIASNSLNLPSNLYANSSGALFVADSGNNRVLGWSTFPTTNRQAANRVLGQTNFTSNSVNSGGLSETSLYDPSGVYVDGTNAWVADTGNHRVLITPINAVLTISDAPTYDFGSLVLNGSTTRTFVITNTGAGNATSVGAGTPAMAAPFTFLGGAYPGTGGTCGATINSQTSCTVVVRFNPTTEAAAFQDALRITYNDSVMTQIAFVGLTGTAILRASLTFTNGATYAFGTKTIGSNTDATLTLSNASGVTASVIKNSASSTLAAPMVYKGGSFPGTGGTCGSVLATGSTCTIVIRFTPTAATAYSRTYALDYFSGDSTLTVSIGLTGTGN